MEADTGSEQVGTSGAEEATGGGHAAGWYPDPLERSEQRYYDGSVWTAHIIVKGEQVVDPLGIDKKATAAKLTEGLGDHLISGSNATKFTNTAARWEGTGHLFTEPVLIVEQHAKMLDTSTSYDIKHPDGQVLGSVRQVGQSQAKGLVSAFTSFDKYMSHSLEILDAGGAVMLKVNRPAKMVKSKIVVEGPDGVEVGRIIQKNVIGKVRFGLEAGGAELGTIQGKNWRDWNFHILDHTGTEVGRITKSFEGLAKAFLGADNYVVEMYRPLEDPLRQLVIAAGVSVDTALHQDD
jgi:uncharacterized protein YxjI